MNMPCRQLEEKGADMSKYLSLVLGVVGLAGVWGCSAEEPPVLDPVASVSGELVDCNESVVGKKITICHHTGSATNPYVGITIAVKGCIAGHQAQHPEDLNPVDGACPVCVADGHACLEDGACCGGTCTNGICSVPQCTASGGSCTGGTDCCSGECCPAGTCL